MIPQIIHYCWFGGNPLPESAKKCIESWKKYLPDYKIIEWNESNYDVHKIPYIDEAYALKKYAFVSDYARFDILYSQGGLYFDTDVEVIRNIDDIISKGNFMGCERDASLGCNVSVAPGLGLGAAPGLGLYKEIMDMYKNMHFVDKDGKQIKGTVVSYTTELLVKKGLKQTTEIQIVDDVWIYPKEYFCPMDYYTSKLTITENTRSIHHYTATWLPIEQRLELQFWKSLGIKPHRFMWHIDKFLKKIGINRM